MEILDPNGHSPLRITTTHSQSCPPRRDRAAEAGAWVLYQDARSRRRPISRVLRALGPVPNSSRKLTASSELTPRADGRKGEGALGEREKGGGSSCGTGGTGRRGERVFI